MAETNIRISLKKELAKKDKELTELKALSDNKLAKKIAEKKIEISKMKSKIDKAETEKK